MKRSILTLAMVLLVFTGNALAYNKISSGELKAQLENQQPVVLVDIQVADEFDEHHLIGATATYAFPVKSAADKAKLDTVLAELKTNQSPAVVVCPRGKGGAKRTYDYLKAGGIAEQRLSILEKGQQGWPYDELVVSN